MACCGLAHPLGVCAWRRCLVVSESIKRSLADQSRVPIYDNADADVHACTDHRHYFSTATSSDRNISSNTDTDACPANVDTNSNQFANVYSHCHTLAANARQHRSTNS